MFEAIKSVWNFSKKRQGSLVKILILSFIEGIFVKLKNDSNNFSGKRHV